MKICKKCNQEFEVQKGLLNYCSIACRNSRTFSEETRKKISDLRKQRPTKINKLGRGEAVTNRRRKLKLMSIEYKGGKCCKCGYNKCAGALQFHHIDPNTKSFSLSEYSRSWEVLKTELDKCELVCANCHAEIHY